MRYLLSTTAGLALLAFALAPSVHAQGRTARAPDLDSPRGAVPETPNVREIRGADQDILGHTRVKVPTRVRDVVSDQDDVTRVPRTLVRPQRLVTTRLDAGREDVSPALVVRVTQANLYPDGREPGLEGVALKSGRATPRTMTEDGRALDARPGALVVDEIAPESEITDAAKTEVAASEITLGVSTPNPVEQTARIAFTLPEAATASLVLFDVRGREVATLFEGRASAGTTSVTVDASSLASGTYVYVLDVGGERMSRRLQVTR